MSVDQTNLVLAFIPQMRTYARKHCATDEDADQAVAITMQRALDGAPSLPAGAEVGGWLMLLLKSVLDEINCGHPVS